MQSKLFKPIILLGAARSGTSLLGNILSAHNDISYWIEPKYIWKKGMPDFNNDIRNYGDFTMNDIDYVKRRFLNFNNFNNKKRFMEKTPSNCFRIPFINSAFPDACYINIIRDGRQVVLSSFYKWTKSHDKTAYSRRLFNNDIPLSDLPFYLYDFVKQLLFQQSKFKSKTWGPLNPKILEARNISIEYAIVSQWIESVKAIDNAIKNLNHINIYYDDLIFNPKKVLTEILNFCNLEKSNEVFLKSKQLIFKSSLEKWRNDKLFQKFYPYIDDINQINEQLKK